jgi:cell division protein FtsB
VAGGFHIHRLRLNRSQLVAQRQRNRELRSLRQRLTEVEQENAALRNQMEAIEAQIRLLLEQVTREFWR